VLTTYDTDEDIYRALRAGAKAYLLKDTPREELLDTIRAVAAGHTRVPADVAAKLAERVSSEALTTREVDVLRLIVAGHSNREIATQLYISEGTVKTHVNHILMKLGASDRTQAATTALKRGLVALE
jgi:two-component system NarL family response regulator